MVYKNQLVLLATWLPLIAASADLQLVGHALGEALTPMKTDARFQCSLPAVRGFSMTCMARKPEEFAVGTVPLQYFALHYDGEHLAAAEAALQEVRHSEAVQALAKTFGQAAVETEKLRAGMGAIFPNAIYLWRQGGTLLRLEQFFRSIKISSVILTTEPYLGKLVIPKLTNERTGIKDL
jgi:hypothetical protein